MVLAMNKLRALVKVLNDIIIKLCADANALSQTVALTRSDRVKEAIKKWCQPSMKSPRIKKTLAQSSKFRSPTRAAESPAKNTTFYND